MAVKTSEFSSNSNVELLKKKLGLRVLAYLGGGTNDNANDAQKEIYLTCEKAQAAVLASDDLTISALAKHNGVHRGFIVNGDLYHTGNILATGGSVAAFGTKVKGDFRQVHHLQCMQSLHDLHYANKDLAQEMIDEVMSGCKSSFRLYTCNERDQRWLVNQNYAREILRMLEYKTLDGKCALVEWAVKYANRMSSWQQTVAKELSVWLQMPEVIVGLHFENDMGKYFRVLYDWHCRTGPLYSRSGFRTLELYMFFKNWEMPFFNNAVADPSSAFTSTMAYIDANFEGEKHKFRRESIIRGIEWSRNKSFEMNERYLFSAPLILTVLCHHEDGPAFARAVL